MPLPWFSFIVLCDWLRKHVPLSQPIISKTKTNRREMLARVFPRLKHLHMYYTSSSDWFIVLFASVVIGQWFWMIKKIETRKKNSIFLFAFSIKPSI